MYVLTAERKWEIIPQRGWRWPCCNAFFIPLSEFWALWCVFQASGSWTGSVQSATLDPVALAPRLALCLDFKNVTFVYDCWPDPPSCIRLSFPSFCINALVLPQWALCYYHRSLPMYLLFQIPLHILCFHFFQIIAEIGSKSSVNLLSWPSF